VELSWGLLLLLLALGGCVLFVNDALVARDRANVAARETCAATGGMLLDGTVAYRSLRVVRGYDGTPMFERTYLFDYSLDGETRQQGFVVVCGRRVESIGLE
jgi:Protein of unknown function (DUF3301)